MILAFDTSGPYCAAAVLSDGKIRASVLEPMTKGQAERLMGLCAEVLAQTGARFEDLTAVGVGIGPGNFTGIRISVSAARGLALGLGVPAVGISVLEALAYGQEGPCAVALDARRDQIYFQTFGQAQEAEPIVTSVDSLPPFDGPLIGQVGQPAIFPIAEAIAFLTQARYRTETTRPAPLYLRAPDAAPAKDAAPTLLP